MLSCFQHFFLSSINFLFSSCIVFGICHGLCNMLHSIRSQLSRQPLFFFNQFQRLRGCHRCLVGACPLATFTAFGAASQHSQNALLRSALFGWVQLRTLAGTPATCTAYGGKSKTTPEKQVFPKPHFFDNNFLLTTFDFNFDDYDN